MEYTTEFDEAKGICTVCVTGRHKRPYDSLVLQRFARDFSSERECQRFLFDMTQAEIIGGAIETFKSGTVPLDVDHSQKRQKIALVYSGDIANHKFMETVAVDRGYNLQVFNQLDKAVEWLTHK
jgi:hypothetical protein